MFFMLHFTQLARPRWKGLLWMLALLGSAPGCTSALTATYLKSLPWDAVDVGEDPLSEDSASPTAETSISDIAGESLEDVADRPPAASREAAIEEAVSRLAAMGSLDPAAQATLVATLQRTQQEDWPTVVEEFGAVLAAATPRIAAKPEVEQAPAAERPPLEDEPRAETVATTAEAAPAGVAPAPEPSTPESDPAPSLTVQNVCFASRVQAWGLVDRFATAEFRPGQEVIVYFELENLTASRSAAGHTTCIDTTLGLVAADGSRHHAWHFEPIAETCPSRRRDYFARYVLQIPEAVPPGDYRIEIEVSDTLAGTTTTTALPLLVGSR
jgi:hypothetical protein